MANLEFGVQSFCFRNFKDNAVVAKMVKELGLRQIEVCGVHADFNDLQSWREIVKIYNDAGVDIVSIGVQTLNGKDEEEKWFECVKAAGASHMSVHFSVKTFNDAVPKAAQLGDKYDVNLAIHCHGGYSFGGSPDIITHLTELGGPRIGLCLDTAWCMQIGPHQGDPVKWAERFKDCLYGLHYKDFTFGKDAMWEDVVVGTGNLDLAALIETVKTNDFNGYAVLEYEGDVENPVPALQQCVDAVKGVIG